MYLTPLVKVGTPKFRRFIVDLVPWKNLHDLRDISDVIQNTSAEIINSKKRALEDGDEAVAGQLSQGKDILSILSKGLSILASVWISSMTISASKSECFRGG